MRQPNCLSDLWRKGAALMTVIVHLCVQVLPAYAMQEGSSDEEQEFSIPKIVNSSSATHLNYAEMINTYAESLYMASNQQEADAILANISSHYQKEVWNLLEKKNTLSGSSSSSLLYNIGLPEKVKIDYLARKDDFKPESNNKLSSIEEEDEQVGSGKRKRAEDKNILLGEDIKHKKT